METLDEYTIYCTEEQTKKAFELGAQIKESVDYHTDGHLITTGYMLNGEVNEKNLDGFGWANILLIPTAEQMMEWLRRKGIHLSILYSKFRDIYNVQCFDFDDYYVRDEYGAVKSFASYKQAALAGIDAALDYLRKNTK